MTFSNYAKLVSVGQHSSWPGMRMPRSTMMAATEFCSWKRERHLCRQYHVVTHKRVLLSICGAVAVFILLQGHGIVTFGWEAYWGDANRWGFGFFIHGTICSIGAIVSMCLDKTAEWKYFASSVGFPMIVVQIAQIGQSGYLKASLG